MNDEKNKTAAMEALFVYHIVKEGQPFTSANCMSKLIRSVFGNNENFSCAETKTEAILSGAYKYLFFALTPAAHFLFLKRSLFFRSFCANGIRYVEKIFGKSDICGNFVR